MTKLLPGELFIVEYVNGVLVNRWAVNSSRLGLEFGAGRMAAAGYTDILFEKDGSALANNRGNVVTGTSGITYLTDAGFAQQAFGGKDLAVLAVLNETAIFNSAGAQIGTIPAGSKIGIESGAAGNSNKHLMAVTAYDNPNDSIGWRYLNQSTYTYGFINVQQGFGLKQYNTVRSIESAFSAIRERDLNWNLVATIAASTAPEEYLRAIPEVDTKGQVEEQVQGYFAVQDLKGVVLGDGASFFTNNNNEEYIVRELDKVDPVQGTKFSDEAAFFSGLPFHY